MAFKDFWMPWYDKYADLRHRLGEAIDRGEEFPGMETLPDSSAEAAEIWRVMHKLYMLKQELM